MQVGRADGNQGVGVRAGAIVLEDYGWRRCVYRVLSQRAAPEFEYLGRIGQAAAAVATTTQRHFTLTDQGIGERLGVSGAEGLESDAAGVGGTIPGGCGNLGGLDPFPLDDSHLPPGPIEPDIP